MKEQILLFLLACGLLFGFISLFINLKKGVSKDRNQLIIATSIIICCSAALLSLVFN